MANTYVPISSTVLGTAQATITFTSIPSSYTDLKLVVSARTTRASAVDLLNMIFNNDSSALYSQTVLYGNGSASAVTEIGGDTSVYYQWIDGAISLANVFGSTEIYIPYYTANAFKPFFTVSAQENNDAGATMSTTSSLYRSATAISSIRLVSHFGENFIAGSSFYLYGIKNS